MVSSGLKNAFDSPLVIRFRGTFDYDGLIALIRQYFKRHLFDRKEPKWKHSGGGGGAEIEFKMEADRKITHYIKAYITIEGHLWGVNPKESVVKGKKIRLTNGKLELKLSAAYEFDFAGRFATHGKGVSDKIENAIEKWMQDFLDKDNYGLMYQDNKTNGKKYLQKMLLLLSDEIRSFLRMECN